MLLFRAFSILCLLFSGLSGYAQVIYPINLHNGQTISNCQGIFTDSGGNFQTPYGPNEDYSLTFCSSDIQKPVLQMSFENFQLGSGDVLYVYDGPDATAPLLFQATGNQLQGKLLYASNGCLHFRFVSSPTDQANGWKANMQCLSLCESFFTDITPLAGKFNYCPNAGNLMFTATSGYLPQNISFNPALVHYSWSFAGTSQSGQAFSTFLINPGAYPVTLTASDPTHGCQSTITQVIRLATFPEFKGTTATTDSACAGQAFALSGVASTTIWTGFTTAVFATTPIPDGSGQVYESSLVFDIFKPDDIILTANDFDRICINIEHAANGQLQFELECPSGNRITLKDFGAGTANLGEPVIWDNVTPGVGYEYCFTNQPAFGTMAQTIPRFHQYTDRAGNYYFNAAFLPAGSYTPENSFSVLAGCPLNGKWTLRIRDNAPGNNGYIFGWKMFFKKEFYPDSVMFLPEITQMRWFRGPNALAGNPASITVNEPGNHSFRFQITDNFGCTFDTTAVVFVRQLPRAEVVSAVQLPVCQGDSTLLSVSPINAINPSWTYQWYFGNNLIPGAVSDTLMAKKPGIYMVQVTDTGTGCFDFFSITVSEQNCELTIPNVFTPNNDGFNDLFEILNLEHYRAQIVIFNRHGRKVFEHSDYYNNWWDGRNAPDGTYYYVLTYTRGQVRRTTEGVITIVR